MANPDIGSAVHLKVRAAALLWALLATAAGSARGDDEPRDVELPFDRTCCSCCNVEPRTLFQWSSAEPSEASPDADEPIVTDRPDFTESSTTVGKGRLQIEMGYTFTRDDTGGVRFQGQSYPETLFRMGMLAEWFELRIAYTFLDEQTDDSVAGRVRVGGNDDSELGVKLALTEQAGWLPEVAIIPQMSIPSGSTQLNNDEVLPGVNWLYSWEINDSVSVGGSTQVNRARDASDHFYAEMAQSATISVSLTDRLGSYGEYFGFYPTGAVAPGVGPEHYLNGGFTFLINNDLQLDVRAGFGLNRNAEDFFTGTGLSVRF